MLSALAPDSQSERVCAKGVLTGTSISSSYKSSLSAARMGKLSQPVQACLIQSLSFLVLEYFPLSRFRFLALLLNQPMRTNFMSPLNPVNPTYFEDEKMGGSVKEVTSHSSSDSFSRGTQLNHISFTEIHSEHSSQGSWVSGGSWPSQFRRAPRRETWPCVPSARDVSQNQFQFHKPVQFQKPVYSYQPFIWPD